MCNSGNGYTLGLYEKATPRSISWEARCRAAKNAGFDYVEISIDETDEKLSRLDMTAKEIERLRRAGYAEDCPVLSMCLSGHRRYPIGSHDRKTRERGMDIMRKAVDFAAQLGIRVIQLAGYDVYYETSDAITEEMFAHGLTQCVAMAAKAGVALGFETMETPFMNTVKKAMQWVRVQDSPFLRVYPDIGNLTNAALLYGYDVREDIAAGRGNILAAHLKETQPGIYREVPFGEGHTEFAGCIEALYAQGVRMYVGEFWDSGAPNWEGELKRAAVFLRAFLDMAARKCLLTD